MLLLPALAIGLLLAWIDLRTLRLPDPLVGLLAVAVAVPSLGSPAGDLARGLGAAVIVFAAGVLCTGVGFGDVKLAAVLAFALGTIGWPAVALGIVVAPPLIAGPAAVWQLLAGRRDPLPYGPALLGGAIVAWWLR